MSYPSDEKIGYAKDGEGRTYALEFRGMGECRAIIRVTRGEALAGRPHPGNLLLDAPAATAEEAYDLIMSAVRSHGLDLQSTLWRPPSKQGA